jgi:hypothetical protein
MRFMRESRRRTASTSASLGFGDGGGSSPRSRQSPIVARLISSSFAMRAVHPALLDELAEMVEVDLPRPVCRYFGLGVVNVYVMVEHEHAGKYTWW